MKSKKKIFLLTGLSVVLIGGLTIYGCVNNAYAMKDKMILKGEKTSDYINLSHEIKNNEDFNDKSIKLKFSEYYDKINSINEKVSTVNKTSMNDFENKIIKFYDNEILAKTEAVIELDDSIYSLDARNVDLISYTQKCPKLKVNTLDEEKIE